MQDWYLDLVCDRGQWDAMVYIDEQGSPLMCWPYYFTKRYHLKTIVMPQLTPYMGLWVSAEYQQSDRMRSFYQRCNELIDRMPKVSWYAQAHPVSLSNWLPFYWESYNQKTMYTFAIHPGQSISPKRDVQNKINWAKENVLIEESEDIELFYQINQKSFHWQGLSIPYSLLFLGTIYKSLVQKGLSKLFIAYARSGVPVGGILLVEDSSTVYNLALGYDRNLGVKGVAQLLLLRGISYAKKEKKTFDFEGSMLKGVHQAFSAFSPELVPYNFIYKARRKWMKALYAIRN